MEVTRLMSIVWQPDTELHLGASPGTYEADTGAYRATLAGYRLGRGAMVIRHPSGARLTDLAAGALADRNQTGAFWRMADGSRVPLAAPAPVPDEERPAPGLLLLRGALGTMAEEWQVEGARLKHTWILPPGVTVPTGATALELRRRIDLLDCRLPAAAHRTAGTIAVIREDRTQMTIDRARVDASGGAVTHGTYEWEPGRAAGSTYLSVLVDAEWLRSVPGEEVRIDPTVSTSTSSVATAYPNQRKIDRFPANGGLLSAHQDGSSLAFRYSRDVFANPQTPTGATIANADNGSLFIDPNEYIHVVYVNSNVIYYRRGTPSFDGSGNLTSISWSNALTISSSNGEANPVVLAHSEGTGWKAHVFWSSLSETPSISVKYQRVNITSGSVITADGSNTALSASYSSSTQTFPAVDIDGSKNLYLFFSTNSDANAVRIIKGTYSAGAWSWGSEQKVGTYAYSGGDKCGPCAVDGSGNLFVAFYANSVAATKVWRRSAAGTLTEISPAGVAGTSPVIVPDTSGNLHLFYIASGVKRRLYNGSTWSAETVIDSDASAKYLGIRRDTSGSAVDVLYITGGGSPYTVKNFRLVLNTAPLTPSNLTPNGSAFDATQAQAFTWQHNDSDGDAQGSRQVQIRRVDTGVTVYDSGKVAGTTQSMTLPGGTLANGLQYQWRVMTWDPSDVGSPWSGWTSFLTSAPPTVTITSPGGTIGSSSYTVTWATSDPEDRGQGQWRVRRYNADRSQVITDTGAQVGQALAYTVTGMANTASYQVGVQAADADGIWGPEAYVVLNVSYTLPAEPDNLTATPLPGRGSIRLDWQPGAIPTGTESGAYHISRRLVDAPASAYRALASQWPSLSYEDTATASGQEYVYRVLAIGSNGVLSDGSTLPQTGAEMEG